MFESVAACRIISQLRLIFCSSDLMLHRYVDTLFVTFVSERLLMVVVPIFIELSLVIFRQWCALTDNVFHYTIPI